MNDSDLQILRSFASGNSESYRSLVRLVESKMAELESIRSIDFEKNVGLQACANKAAYDILWKFFRELELASKSEDKKSSLSFR